MSNQYNPDYPTSGRMLTKAELEAPREPLDLHADCIRRDDPALVDLLNGLQAQIDSRAAIKITPVEGQARRTAIDFAMARQEYLEIAFASFSARMEGEK